jgi:hypothetical protein
MFDVKFSCDTQLTFGSLTFVAGEDGDLKMLPSGPAPEHLALASLSHQADPAQGQIPMQGVTSAPPRSFGVSQS